MTPVERLRAFIADMLQWEVTLAAQRTASDERWKEELDGDPSAVDPRVRKQMAGEREQISQEAREKLRSIFTEHLSVKALATTAQSQLALMQTCSPPEYEQKVLADTEIRRGRRIYIEAFITVGGLAPHRRYSLVMENGGPKIDAVLWRSDSEDKWSRGYV
ncbi:MAG: RhsIA family immunity protein [Zoogloeaceae bacterium]|nr:RhsIA family immunity protein [Zoogloeaceae bacterium]